jgi:hypothetical protein
VALRATVRSLRAELDSVWAETAAAAAAVPELAGVGSIELDLRPDIATTEILLTELREIVLADLPVVRSAEKAEIEPADEPAIVPADQPAIVLSDQPAIVLSDLPESELLDPKLDRDGDVIDVTEPATASAAETVLPERRSA